MEHFKKLIQGDYFIERFSQYSRNQVCVTTESRQPYLASAPPLGTPWYLSLGWVPPLARVILRGWGDTYLLCGKARPEVWWKAWPGFGGLFCWASACLRLRNWELEVAHLRGLGWLVLRLQQGNSFRTHCRLQPELMLRGVTSVCRPKAKGRQSSALATLSLTNRTQCHLLLLCHPWIC